MVVFNLKNVEFKHNQMWIDVFEFEWKLCSCFYRLKPLEVGYLSKERIERGKILSFGETDSGLKGCHWNQSEAENENV